ncbi:MAG: PorV/PorQ family protein [Chrysiogenales bacterium]|nr:MAG: PorV/PorQ family protein [Chrysiogenales bacterium]
MRSHEIIGKILLAIMLLAASRAVAAGTVGTSGAGFLEFGIGSRALGMGEAFTAEIDDINGIYFNPASLGTLQFPQMAVFHHELIMESRLENITLCYPIKDGFLGVANTMFWVPEFDKVDINGLPVGKVQFYNGCLTVGYGYDFDYLYVGGSAKYIYQRIDTKLVHAFAVDVGFLKGFRMWTPFEAPLRNFHIGLSFLNLGTKVMDSPLPRQMRIGLSYRPLHWLGVNLDLMQNCIKADDLVDFTRGFDESFRLNLGIELSYLNLLYLRGGWRFNDTGTYTVGLGFNYVIKNVSFTIDASFADSGEFNPTYSFTVTFKLIPKVVTIEDRMRAEDHYRKGIRSYVGDDIEGALKEFKTTKDYDPYHRNIDKKIRDLKEILDLKKQNLMEDEKERYEKTGR